MHEGVAPSEDSVYAGGGRITTVERRWVVSMEETLVCPCCTMSYTVAIEGSLDVRRQIVVDPMTIIIPRSIERATLVGGSQSLDVCSTCNLPCCPRCESICGEGLIVCTRCTTYPDCTHPAS